MFFHLAAGEASPKWSQNKTAPRQNWYGFVTDFIALQVKKNRRAPRGKSGHAAVNSRSTVNRRKRRGSAQQRQRHFRSLVGLHEDRAAGLLKDLVLRERRRFFGEVDVADAAVGRL